MQIAVHVEKDYQEQTLRRYFQHHRLITHFHLEQQYYCLLTQLRYNSNS
jgi:hypothetical protein